MDCGSDAVDRDAVEPIGVDLAPDQHVHQHRGTASGSVWSAAAVSASRSKARAGKRLVILRLWRYVVSIFNSRVLGGGPSPFLGTNRDHDHQYDRAERPMCPVSETKSSSSASMTGPVVQCAAPCVTCRPRRSWRPSICTWPQRTEGTTRRASGSDVCCSGSSGAVRHPPPIRDRRRPAQITMGPCYRVPQASDAGRPGCIMDLLGGLDGKDQEHDLFDQERQELHHPQEKRWCHHHTDHQGR